MRGLSIVAAGAALFLAVGPALADESMVMTPAPTPSAPAETIWTRDTLTGNWDGLLDDTGVKLDLGYTGDVLGVVKGGVDTGFAFEGRLTGGLTLDLEKLLGWGGATIYASAFQIHNINGLAVDHTGSLADPSNVEGTEATRLFTFWLEQTLFNNSTSIRIGQLAADDEFITSDTAANLINGTFGWPVFVSGNLPNGGPAFPLAAPGARVSVKASDSVTLLAGVFAGDPAGGDCFGGADPQVCNYHGTEFSLTGGTLGIAEVQYALNGGENATGLPGTYKLGAWYQADGAFTDQRTGDPKDDDFGIYAVIDQTILRDGARSLSVFTRVGVAPNDRNLVSFYADGGFGLTGLIPGRDSDVLTFGASYMDISSKAEQADIDAAVTPVRDHEIAFELNYSLAVTPWLKIVPDVQYIVHPGGNVANPVTGDPIDEALVVGARTSITF